MPIYEYACVKCGAHTEVMQRAADKPLTKCSQCGGKMEKQWSTPGIQFKGAGWYVTDYAGKKASSTDGEKKSESPVETAATTDKSDAKTAKSEAKTEKKENKAASTSSTKTTE